MPQIISVNTENNDFQRFEVLKNNRNKRHKYKEFFVEGVRNINEAISNSWDIRAYLYSPQKPLSTWGKDILARSTAKIHYELQAPLMEKPIKLKPHLRQNKEVKTCVESSIDLKVNGL